MIVGDHTSALKELEYVLSIPFSTTLHLLRLDPRWDPLRGDPGFQRLLADYEG